MAGRKAKRGGGAFVSDREREVLEAVFRMATSNPFAPDRIEQERRAHDVVAPGAVVAEAVGPPPPGVAGGAQLVPGAVRDRGLDVGVGPRG